MDGKSQLAPQAPLQAQGAFRWFEGAGQVLWALLLVTIPFSSHPWVAGLVGWSTVSPLSALPLIVLVIAWLPVSVFRTRSLPRAALPLLGFAAAAVFSAGTAFFIPILPTFDQSILQREIRALVTLATGIGFYLVASSRARSEHRLRQSLRWLYLGGFLLLAYSTFQVVALPGADDPVPEALVTLHRLFVVRDPFRSRVTGFAYEPSWLGNQLVLLYLPLWISSVARGYSAFEAKLWRLSVEHGLLLWGIVVLFFSFARLAWLSFALILAALVVASSGRLAEGLARSGRSERLAGMVPADRSGRRRRLVIAIVGVGCLLLAGLVLVLGASAFDERISDALKINLRDTFSGRHPWPYRLANELKYAERLMYWVAGFRIFSLYPMVGVGPGNAGFLMPDSVPAFGLYLPEIIRAVHNGSFGVPNTKSLWIRLLAETGIIGFALLVTWLVVVASLATRLLSSSDGLRRTFGLAGLLALTAQITEGFSLDTFALPQLWVVLGLVTAASWIEPGPSRRVEAVIDSHSPHDER